MISRASALAVLGAASLVLGVAPQITLPQAPVAVPSSIAAPGTEPAVATTFLSSFAPREYVVEVGRWGIPVDGTRAPDTTDRLQAAIDWASQHGFGVVRVPKGVYLLGKRVSADHVDGIRLPSDLDFRLSSGTVLRMVPNDAWNSCLVTVSGRRNVRITGGVFEGDRAAHTYTPRASDGSTAHDEGHGICIWNESANVAVERVVLRSFTGDGVLLHGGGTDAARMVRDVVVRDCDIYGSRRQGISVVRGQNVVIENNDIHDISGVAPQFGIDLETPKGQGRSRNIMIRGNRFRDNAGGHVVNFDATNVWLDANTMEQTAGVSQTDGPIILHKGTDGVVRGNRITMTDKTANGLMGILSYSDGTASGAGPSTTVVGNTCVKCAIFLRDLPPSRVEQNTVENGHISLQRMEVSLSSNTVTQTTRYGYSFDRVTGTASGNRLNGASYAVPLSGVPYTANWY